MNRLSYKKLNKAFALEYVVILMVFVIAVTGILLSYATFSVNSTKTYKNYLLQKQFLDKNAENFILGGTVLNEKNDYDITFIIDENLLIAIKEEKILLSVEVIEESGERSVKKYVYGE